MTDIFVVIYLDDILIFSNSLEDHRVHVQHVLERLCEYDLHCKPKKCLFHTQKIEFLGFMVTPTGISIDTAKTDAVSVCPAPMNLKAVQAFLGFANFYHRFIVGFSNIVIPLIRLTRKDTPFTWSPDHTKVFETLKKAFTQAPILVHFNPDNPIVVETDASDYAIAAIISQISPDDGDIHPIAFYSRSMQLAELNYEIYDKELLTIFEAFRQWRNYLEGSAHVVLVFSDHKNLEYFVTTKQLTCCQVHWSEYISGFSYLICYHAGWLGTNPDAFTHHKDVYPYGEHAYALDNHTTSSPCSRPASYCKQSSSIWHPSSSPSDMASRLTR